MPTSVPLSSASQAIETPREEGSSRDSRRFPVVVASGSWSPELGTYPDVPGVDEAGQHVTFPIGAAPLDHRLCAEHGRDPLGEPCSRHHRTTPRWTRRDPPSWGSANEG